MRKLQKINTGRYDPQVRREYAEQIKQRDPVRAEFILRQVWLAHNEDSAGDTRRLAYTRSVRRAESQRGGDWWPAELKKAGVSSAKFHAGFVDHIAIEAAHFLEHATVIFRCAPIRHLTLTGVKPHLEKVLALPAMERVVSLDLSHNHLDDADAMLIADASLPALKWLSLAANRLEFPGVQALANAEGFPRLRYLDLEGNPCNPLDRPAYDEGAALDSWRTTEGARLESVAGGPIPWLRGSAQQASRFSLENQSSSAAFA
ncbi:MAG: leucine-rich repeat domain-containing protein [Bryobacteraceae bacterium]